MKLETQNNKKRFMLHASCAMILLLSFVLSFAAPPLALAQTPTTPKLSGGIGECGALSSWFACGVKYFIAGIGGIGYVVQSILSILTFTVGAVFDYALRMNLDLSEHIKTVEVGWRLSRDVANMFFILILLAIAIGTILRVTSYQAKVLLPKLIIIALLINFSMTIGSVVIDFSNILGKQFYNAILGNYDNISTAVMQGVKPQALIDWETGQVDQEVKFYEEFIASGLNEGDAIIQSRIKVNMQSMSNSNKPKPTDSMEAAILFAKTIWGNVIIFAVLPFVLFVALVILLVRAVMLMLLLVLAPIAFLFYILPDTEQHWKKWWSALISHSFFFPAFMFLLYITILFTSNVAKLTERGDLFTTPSIFFTYVLAVVMLLAALILGRSMGVYGANTAMAWATTGRKLLTGAVGGVALRNTIGRAGQAMQERGIWQESVFGRRITGAMFGAGKNLPGGSREQMVKEQAAIAAMKSERDMARDFAENPAIRKELMRDRKTPEGLYGLRSNLEKYHPDATKEFDRLMNTQFKDTDRAALETEKMKHVPKEEMYKRFNEMEPSEKKAYIQSVKDADERARVVNGWEKQAEAFEKEGKPEEAQKTRNAAAVARAIIGTTTEADWQKKAEDLETRGDTAGAENARSAATATRGILSTATEAEKKDFKFADYKMKARKAQAENTLKEFVNTVSDDDMSDLLEKSTNSDQVVAFLDGEVSGSDLMKKVRKGINKMPFEAKDKFHSGLLRNAPDTTVSSYMNSVRAEIEEEAKAERKESANAKRLEEERIFANYLSAPQQVAQWKDAKENPEKYKRHLELVGKQSADKSENYNRAFISELRRGSVEEIAEENFYTKLPEAVRRQWVSDQTQVDRVANIAMSNKTPAKVKELIMTDIGESGAAAKYEKTRLAVPRGSSGKPEVKMSPKELVTRIEKSTTEEIKETVTTKVLENTEFVEDILSAAPLEIIQKITQSPDLQSAFSKTLHQIAEKLEPKLAGKEITADELANVFEIKLKNKELADSVRESSQGQRVWEAILRSRGLKT